MAIGVRVTAQRTTGSNGRPTWGGFDLSNMYADPAGDRVDFWDRDVTYQTTVSLEEALVSNKLIKYNLLLNIMLNDEKVGPTKEGRFYASGAIKEIRVGRTAYRIAGTKYLGKQTVKLQLGEK